MNSSAERGKKDVNEKVEESPRRLRVNRLGRHGMTVRQYARPTGVSDYESTVYDSNATASVTLREPAATGALG